MSHPVRTLLAAAAIAAAAAAIARRLEAYAIAEDSMQPALHDGDWVLAIRTPASTRVGDIVVVDHPTRPGFELVKRVAAVAGDTVGERILEAGTIWALGDAPWAGSVDSRSLGPIPVTSVRARILLRYHPGPPRWLGRSQRATRR